MQGQVELEYNPWSKKNIVFLAMIGINFASEELLPFMAFVGWVAYSDNTAGQAWIGLRLCNIQYYVRREA